VDYFALVPEPLSRRPHLADPVHLDDDHPLAADIGQVNEHEPTSLDGPQPGRIAGESWAIQEDRRLAYGQFRG
jgi:hypothetical protein